MTEREQLRQDYAGAIFDATGLRGDAWATVSDVADEYALADHLMRVLDEELARVVAERDEARQQTARYLEGAEYERERASSEARCADERGDLFRQMRTERDMERGQRATAEAERDEARAEAIRVMEHGERSADYLREQIKTLRWLHAEAAWQRDQAYVHLKEYNDAYIRATTKALRADDLEAEVVRQRARVADKAGRAAVAATLRRLSGLRGNGLNNLRTANLAVLASVVERDGDTHG